MQNRSVRFQFEGKGGQKLDGRLELPLSGKPRAVALFAHCFTCTKSSHGATRISAALAAEGIATLRFDFTGLGGSGGEFANAGFAANVDDLVAAADALAKDGPGAPQLLVGHSLGGAAVIAAAGQIDSVKAIATVGAPFEVEHVLLQLGDGLKKVEEDGEAEVQIGGRPFRVAKSFIDQTRNQPQDERLAKLGRPLLVMHAPDDDIVPFAEAEALFAAASQPKSFTALGHADHLLTREGAGQRVAAQIAAWATPWLDFADIDKPELEGSLVRVSGTGGKFTQLVETADHELLADEPASVKGDNLGPTPYDLLLAALGSCTSMTIKMYADRKGWKLEQAQVLLEHSREHRADCEDCNNGQIDVIDRVISLDGDLDEEQRAKLIDIADRCPVHRTLTNHIEINSLPG